MNRRSTIPVDQPSEQLAPKRRFRPYPEYQDSGVECLGDVPEHWDVRPLKRYLRVRSGDMTSALDLIDEGYPVFGGNGFRGYIDKWNTEAKTIIIGRYGALCGNVRITGERTWATEHAFRVCPLCRFHTAFFARLLDSLNLNRFSSRTAQPGLNSGMVRGNIVCVPPFCEQQAIAAFLDRETARIDELVAKKQRLIELLAEKRTALISHAVTKGLSPDVPMKDTGIEWVGHVPSRWMILPLKFVARLQTGLTLGKKYDDAQSLVSRPYLRVANVQDGYLDLEHITQVELPSSHAPRYELKQGDMLMTEGGDFDKLGRGYVWDGQIEGCLHQNHIFAVRPDARRLAPRFLACLTSSLHGKAYFTSTSSQTTNLASTNSTKLNNFPVLLPPLAEQEAVLAHTTLITQSHDELVQAIQEAVLRLREYRSALISAAVTGKIDVRSQLEGPPDDHN